MPDIQEKMQNIKTIFIVDKFLARRSGAVASVINRARIMETNWGHKPLIIACEYDSGLEALKAETGYDRVEGLPAGEGNVIERLAAYLNQMLQNDKFYMLVFEDGQTSPAAGMIEAKNAAKIIMVHSAFSEDPYDFRSKPQSFYAYLCGNPEKFNAIVFPTRDARNDFTKRFGRMKSSFVVPHPYPNEIIKSDFEERDHRKAVIVSRFDNLKKINYSIEVFAAVQKKLPDVRLEIYGFGPEEKSYRVQIEDLNLSGNIFIKGYTDDSGEVFRGAALSMTTSLVEGYGLALVESICNGCPAFAFDVKYGPSEIIKDRKTGGLIGRNDRAMESYAKRLTAYFEDIAIQRTMSENCYADAGRFSGKNFLENWARVVEAVYVNE